MKIVTLSDIHGYLPENLPDGEVLIIAGDICPVQDHSIGHQKWWLENRFNLWLDNLPYKEKVVVAGNHDWIFESAPNAVPKLNCNYLEDSCVIIDHVKFYGYPHTPRFCDWAFNRGPDSLWNAACKIPEDTDVLITHGPPFGILDVVTDVGFGGFRHDKWDSDDRFLGCKQLKKRLNDLPNLKLHVFGHIHSAHGIEKPSGLSEHKTTFVNASYINEQYKPDYGVIVVDI